MSEQTDLQAPDIDPETGWNRRMVEQMAESIRLAHEINPRSWCIHTWNDQPILSVGFVTSGSVGPVTPYGLVIASDELDPAQAAMVDHLKDARTYRDRPWAVYVLVPKDECEETLILLKRPHEAAISRMAAEVKSIAHRWKDHREDFRREFERILGQPLPEPAYVTDSSAPSEIHQFVSTKRYWKISPGSYASEWDTFRDRGLIAMHWSDDAIDLSTLPTEEAEFKSFLAQQTDIGLIGRSSLWNLTHQMKVGDRFLAYGNKAVVGHGTIEGPYVYADDDFKYRHRRPVNWKSTEARSIDGLSSALQNKLMRNATLIELTEPEFLQAIGESAGIDPQAGLPLLTVVQSNFASHGLHYTDTQVATFYTALQTKGFVVLSGISGTGKSKIAQGFVEMLPVGSAAQQHWRVDPELVIALTVKPYMRKYRRVIIPIKQVDLLPAMEPGTSGEVRLRIDGASASGRLESRIHSAGGVIRILYFHGEVGNAIEQLSLDQPLYLNPIYDEDGESLDHIQIITEPELLPEDVSTFETNEEASNHLFLSARPDWRDSTSLLGYYNPLTQTYEWTDFLHFLLRAAESHKAKDGLAWFVILDEMNLAHVEYYFADLLSVIESGRDEHGMSREPIRLTFPDTLVDNTPPTEIYLPPNLYIIGTVNMDETTHAFSPKVLDRAFTIELTDVDFSAYPGNPNGATPDVTEAAKTQLLKAFTRGGRFAIVDKDEIRQIVEARPEIRQWLQSLNTELMRDRFHFGFRVFDEIAQFVHNADANEMLTFEEAFDHAVFMKVLPKFTGSRARLLSPLLSVLAWAIAPDAPDPKAVNEAFLKLLEESDHGGATLSADAMFPHVASRALQMLETLEMDGFVSFG
jgi:hypothetical protein